MDYQYFSKLLPQLADRSRSAALSRLGFSHAPLYRHLSDLFSRPFGETGSFLADPTFEATFGWQGSDKRMADLAGSLLCEQIIDALDKPPKEKNKNGTLRDNEYRIPLDRFPYSHQLKSWEILASPKPQSLIVASGTGSGKTECFMVPILDRLARIQQEQNSRLIGVRALFLYPLNALINSQKSRLAAWTNHFDDRIRFCLFNGNTPKQVQSHKKREYPSEVLDRDSLRASPPPILVTNATMLEYMLVRTADKPILEQSQGKLEWVVLDEAHSYVGSQAAELALLIRRVLHAFGVSPDQVRFVATSATIGDPRGEAGDKLKNFLAQVAGVSADRVHLVAGERYIEPLPSKFAEQKLSLEELSKIEAGSFPDQPTPERYRKLQQNPVAREIRQKFIANQKINQEKGGSGMVARLSEVCEVVFGKREKYTTEQQVTALTWLDLLSDTRSSDSATFLPLRAHLFHQTISGIWACADPICPEKNGTFLQDEKWPFGKIYLEPRKHCNCGAPAYELVACDDCGSPHLLAAERGGKLLHPKGNNAIDEFELEFESEDESTEDDALEDDEELDSAEFKVLVVNRSISGTGAEIVDRRSRQYVNAEKHQETLRLIVQGDTGEGLECPCCGGSQDGNRHRRLFQEARIGAPFSLGIILPTLLEFAPDGEKPAEHPYRGRRLLTFNDSRQGTARIAAKLQQESERDRIRSLVYHIALRDGFKFSSKEAQTLRDEIKGFENILTHIPEQGRSFIEQQIAGKKEQLARLSLPTPIKFDEMVRTLSSHGSEFDLMLNHYRNNVSYESFIDTIGGTRLAQMFLVREFGRRPKRLNNLESMGMVAVVYPALQSITQPHPGFTLEQWQSFLKICLDFFVRAGGSLDIDPSWRNWLGIPFPQTWLVEQNTIEKDKKDRRWPRAQYILPKGKKKPNHRSILVRLLAHHLKADIETAYGEDIVDHALKAAWKALTEDTGILKSSGSGRRILPLSQLAFSPISAAWICPVTRRFLDTTLNEVTPYLPVNHIDATRNCARKDIPLYSNPFGGDETELQHIASAREWLKQQSAIEQLREEGVWPVMNDRTIELSPFFVTGEHSAQQPSDRLNRYENAFKDGDLNLLSCSTTMEMGIDIGGISMVAMNNVPPHPANYLQRAGRAGRRKEARSTSLTLCKSNPHDQIVFSNTNWPFVSKLPAPIVSLNSDVIVQRHVNSMVLSHFLATQVAVENTDASKLTCGWFFTEPEGSTTADKFVIWCESFLEQPSSKISSGLIQLIRHSCYEGASPKSLARIVSLSMQSVLKSWLPEWESLCRNMNVTKSGGDDNPAYKAAKYQVGRMAGEYLLRELATQGFLPAYGFPTHIAAFDNMTISQAKKLKRENEQNKDREDNSFRHRELASRDRVSALREYAPGAEIVMDGLVYRSSGITLNWHAPANQQQAHEIQAIKYAWLCTECNHSGSVRQIHGSLTCAECHSEIDKNNIRTYIEPAGFSTDFYSEPDNDVTTQEFIPVESPWVSSDGDWSPLPNPHLGQFRVTTRGHIFHQSRGVHEKGYAICLTCGRSEPMHEEGKIPEKLRRPHNKLRGGGGGGGGDKNRRGIEECPGSHEDWMIKAGVTLGHEEFTDVLEIQLRGISGLWLRDRDTALTLAVVLRDSLAYLLGVQSNELGCSIKESRPDLNSVCRSILIYDRHAAGYASSATVHMNSLFETAQKRLNCPAQCDSSCPHCVLDFDQRFNADSLDRHAALEFLTSDWLNQMQLPKELSYLGQASKAEISGLYEAILNSCRNSSGKVIRLFAGGSSVDCDLGLSPLRELAFMLAAGLHRVTIIVEKSCLDSLEEIDRRLLASLASYPDGLISVSTVASLPTAGDASVTAEVISGESSCRWAVADSSAIIFGPSWGKHETTLVVATGLEPLSLQCTPLATDSFFTPGSHSSDKEIEIFRELDGPIQGFGKRFWELLSEKSPNLGDLISNPGSDINGVEYHDRYLFTPLAAALLTDLIVALRDNVGNNRWSVPVVKVTTTLDSSNKHTNGRFVWDNWPDLTVRDNVIRSALDFSGIEGSVVSVDKQKSLHGRVLTITFSSGHILTVRLDQGVSFWRAVSTRYEKRPLFNFTEPQINIQGEEIARLAINIEASPYPTHVFTRVRNAE